MQLTFVILALTGLSAALTAWLLIAPKAWWRVSATTSVFQLYTVPLGGIFPSLSFLSALGAANSLWRGGGACARFWMMRWYLLLCCTLLLSLAWSSNPVKGIREVIYLLTFVFLVASSYLIARQDRSLILRALSLVMAFTVVEALLTIVFRVAPSVEMRFLGSPVARVFISPNMLGSIFDGTVTILDAAKAGGFFLNANVASVFLGVSSVIAWYLAGILARPWLRAIAVIDWLAVFCTGSKAGMALAVVVPCLIVLWEMVRVRRFNVLHVMVIFGALVLGIVGWEIGHEFLANSSFFRQSSDTLDSRVAIWRFAASMAHQHLLAGLGFGGWEERFPLYALANGVNPNFPPHNAFLILWTNSGIPAVLAGAAFVVSTMLTLLRFSLSRHPLVSQLGMGCLGAYLWFFIQSLGENYGLMGEAHLTPIFATLIGLLFACETNPQPE